VSVTRGEVVARVTVLVGRVVESSDVERGKTLEIAMPQLDERSGTTSTSSSSGRARRG
jgi:hypothetical protein